MHSEIIKLKKILHLKNNLVGVLFTSNYLEHFENNVLRKKEFVCHAIKKASEKKVFCFSKENTLCNIGSYFLGFSEKPEDDEFNLVEKDKVFSSYDTARKFYLHTPQPKNPYRFVYVMPFEDLNNTCDLILMVVNPLQLSIILGILVYSEGFIESLSFYGPLCQTAITAPYVEDKISISFLDFGSRCEANFKKDEQVLSLPYRYFNILLENLKTSGIAKKLNKIL